MLGRYIATELWLELGRYVATERGAFSRCVTTFFELSPDVSFFLSKAFRKKESISKKIFIGEILIFFLRHFEC